MNPDDLMALINSYYNDPNSFSDEEAELIGLNKTFVEQHGEA